jgi:2-C-methyl-D-erythritol 4-phosphate cytidylyltransferase/2-C-methyl-D-erythritol 2,4-cyclodiphosphate synthase
VSDYSQHPPTVGVIIPAGGIGSRLGRERPKQLLDLAGRPMLARTCQAFLEITAIRQVVIAVPAAHSQATIDALRPHLAPADFDRLVFTVGGLTRQDSVRAGLARLDSAITLVLVHDAARPLVDRATIERCLDAAWEFGAAIAAVPVKDTLKLAAGGGAIEKTVDRTDLWQAQTPQAMQREYLERAAAGAARTGFVGTDEASLLEAAAIPVRLVVGSERNLKITHPEDMRLAEALLREEHPMKIGHGFDAHRLVVGRPLILGGVTIDFELGLDGHSDADVVAHALTDALLGALGAGDIGRHFPDSDPQYKGIDSLFLLEQVRQLADRERFALVNADITIVCQRPRLAPHLAVMQANLARYCGVAPQAINIKATTTEHMGYTGRGEGIAAHAVVLLRSEHGPA